MISTVTVFCSSSNLAPLDYYTAASDLGSELAKRNIGLVFGGGRVGLMGCIADAVMEQGGTVRGIIPRFLEEREVAHYGLSELHVVETMHERKMKLAEWGDAYLVLPGGFGTIADVPVENIYQLSIHQALLQRHRALPYRLWYFSFCRNESLLMYSSFWESTPEGRTLKML